MIKQNHGVSMELLKMQGICKSFNGVKVLQDACLEVAAGEVHALLGENGAGKSTLMNILTGTIAKDAGSISFAGEAVKDRDLTVSRTEKLGIAFVHQELNLFNDLKVFENIFINKEYTGFLGRLDKKRMTEECRALFERLGVNIDPTAEVSELKTSEKQLVEISKALFFNARLLILDEPTTALNNAEVEHLFSIVRALTAKGISFIFISHKMPEIFAYADRYTVMRNGCFVGAGVIAETNPGEITSLMVGHSEAQEQVYTPRETGETVLELSHLSGAGFNDISLEVKKGQVIGMTGLQGCGTSELMQCIFGLSPAFRGSIKVRGRELKGDSVHEAMRAGIALLAANRKENSVIPDLSILENMYLSEHTLSAGRFHIHEKQERERYARYKEFLNLKAESPDMSILSLSGGNQQKVFIARWLNTDADILLFDNPTQGIDVGAKAEIYRLILDLAKAGKTVLVNTLEIPELQKVADCCYIFFKGEILKVLSHAEIEEHRVMMYSTNSVAAGER